ncbi:hypothetical protein STAS_32477 [Striga asiatica]|uniref:Uncharacterized protein n=1 Tax=Striga asiatica TaxID=4170 RepID=A0A5A7RAS3_STRAF|nr:hypothetical protein STAS_32477 [Striga asiatica]
MAWAISAATSILTCSSSYSNLLLPLNFWCPVQAQPKKPCFHARFSVISSKRNPNFICRAEKEYKFPDPIPEFADSESEKFKNHLLKKLSKKEDMFGDSIDEVVGICTQIFNNFLHTEYGGPGTLMVDPFIDMADTLNERGLPGGPQTARAAVKWAQAHVDEDWDEWTSS